MATVSERSEARLETRTRIIEVAAKLLRERGSSGLTTRAIADAAGVQAPTIYRLFTDKDGLLDALAEHALANYVSRKTQAEPTGDPVAELREAWERHIGFGLENPELFVLLTNPHRAAHSPAAEAGQEVLRARVGRIAAVGRLRVSEHRAVELIHAAGTGAVLTLLASQPGSRDSGLAPTLFDSILRTILTDAPGLEEDPIASAAIALRAAVSDLDAMSPGERSLLGEWLDRIPR